MSQVARALSLAVIGLAIGLGPGRAAAHRATSTTSEVSVSEGGRVRYALSFATRGSSAPPLHQALGTPEDQEPSDEELAAARHRLSSYLLERVRVSAASGLACETERVDLDIGSGALRPVTLLFDVRCPGSEEALVEYHLFFEHDPLHNGWLNLDELGRRVEDVFKSARRERRVALAAAKRTIGDAVLHGLGRASRPLGIGILIAGALLLAFRPGAARRRLSKRQVLGTKGHTCRLAPAPDRPSATYNGGN